MKSDKILKVLDGRPARTIGAHGVPGMSAD
jgi:hypothetical protein